MPGEDFYELLGVAKDVSPDELRRAYKRTALRSHPDRGGSTEGFQALQRAYSILNDPYQRKLYDQFGEEAVLLMEGNAGPDIATKVFARISFYQRAQIVLIFFCITSFFTLSPIFVTLRWDEHIQWPWMACFVPLWVLHSLACVPVLLMPSSPPPEDCSEEDWDVALEVQRRARLVAVVIMSLLLLLEIFVAMRLDGFVDWSWHVVLAPWALLEFFAVVRKLVGAQHTSGFPNIGWNLVRLAMAFSIGAKMNGHVSNWDTAFIPAFVGIGVSFCLTAYQCRSADPLVEDTDQPSGRSVAATGMLVLLFVTVWVGLVLLRLDDPEEISAIVTMIPLFLPPYLFCFCLSCFVCCITEETGNAETMEEPLIQDNV